MARGDRALPACAFLGVWMCVAGAGCGPKSVPAAVPSGAGAVEVQVDPAVEQADAERAFAEIVAGHNARTEHLDTFESRASLEMRYADSAGDHFDQCEADIFMAPGGRGAMRASKLGENLLWVGGDGTRGWVFRLDHEPTSLIVYDHVDDRVWGQSFDNRGGGDFTMLTPRSVRVLAGMAPIQGDYTVRRIAGAAAGAPVHERFELHWAPFPKVEGVMRFDAAGLPTQLVVNNGAGNEIMRATLSEYATAQAANLAQGAWPKVARRIEVHASEPKAEVRLYLDEPVAMVKRMKPKFFMLDELTTQLRPDSVAHYVPADAPPAAAKPPGAAKPTSGAGTSK